MSRRLSLFNSPFLLGFDQVGEALDRVSRGGGDGYPPYNIEQLDAVQLRITVAVAGFEVGDLSVQLEQNQLVIRGRKKENDDGGRVFLHHGIATRQFQRAFILSEDIDVLGACFGDGLLHVDLRRPIPETTVRTISITSGKDGKNPQTIEVNGNNG